MGYYINPPDTSKEQFLAKHGKVISADSVLKTDWWRQEEVVPVCLVDNGGFTAAGIAYDAHEARHFLDSVKMGDLRPMIWFLVPRNLLVPYCAELKPKG